MEAKPDRPSLVAFAESPSRSSGSLASEPAEVALEKDYSELILHRRNSGSFLRHSPVTASRHRQSGVERDALLGVHEKVLRAASREALRPESRELPPASHSPRGLRRDSGVAFVARARMLSGVVSLPTLGGFRLGDEGGEEGSPRSTCEEEPAQEASPFRGHGKLPRPEAARVAPVFRVAESFLPEPSVQERRVEDVKSYHKELLASEVGQTKVLPRARVPSMPAFLDRKELSAKVRRKYPVREWHSQAPEARHTTEEMEYYSVRHDATWSMPSRGTSDKPRRAGALRPRGAR